MVKRRLEAYRRSAVDPRVLQHPMLAQHHPLLRLHGKNDGTVLTSSAPRRTVTRPYSYAAVKELETREQRIRDLFGWTQPSNVQRAAGLVSAADGHDGNPSWETVRQMSSLARACRVADLIGDCVARVVARAGWVDGYNAHLAAADHSSRCPCNSWGSALVGFPAEEVVDGVVGGRGHQPLPPAPADVDIVMMKLARAVREAQLALVHGLSQWDLAYLSWLTEVAGASYSQSVPKDMALSDPEHLEKRTAFQECVLRRGASVSMWAFCAEDLTRAQDEAGARAACRRQVDDAVRLVLGELFLWETGHGADRVPLDEAFPSVVDPALAPLVDAFDRAVDGGRDAGDDGGERSILALQPGLQMTTVRNLSKKADLRELLDHEKKYVRLMLPYDDMSARDWDEGDSSTDEADDG